MATAVIALALVVFVMMVTDSPARRWVAGGVLVFGTLQWLFLGLLGRQFAAEDARIEAERLQAERVEDGDARH